MSVKVTLNKANVLRRINNGVVETRKDLTNEIDKYSGPYTPHRGGTLEDTRIVNTDAGTITYTQEKYAKRVWYGIDMNFTKQPNTKATFKWCEKAVQDNKKALDNIAQKAFNKGMK